MPQLREAPVRDLAWLLLSADLFYERTFPASLAHIDGAGDDSEALAQWLVALDQCSEPLQTFLADRKSPRLGHYAERLLQFYLCHGPGYRLLAAGLQIRERTGGPTVGECDFLIERLRDGALLHWELAVKFYLYVPDAGFGDSVEETAAHWLGPNLADSLDAKVRRLVQHQLRLTHREAAQVLLPNPGPWSAQALVKGWLFHPLTASNALLPDIISPGHARGWWASLSDWSDWNDHVGNQSDGDKFLWMPLPRARWLSPARLGVNDVLLTCDALRAAIEAKWHAQATPEAIMVVAFKRYVASESANEFECCRGFIVPDDWLMRARRRIADHGHQA